MKRILTGELSPDEARQLAVRTIINHGREILGLSIAVALVAILACVGIFLNASSSGSAVSGTQKAQKDVKAAVPEAKEAATKAAKKESIKTRVIIRREIRPIVKKETRTTVRREIGKTGATGAVGAPCDPDKDPRCQGPPGPEGKTGPAGIDGASCDPDINPKCQGPVGPEGKTGREGPPCDPILNPMCQGPPGQNGANGMDGQPGPPPQAATIQFTDGTGQSHTCMIDFTVGPSVVQSCT